MTIDFLKERKAAAEAAAKQHEANANAALGAALVLAELIEIAEKEGAGEQTQPEQAP